MLWLGILAIASSVSFFIAANWNDFGRFAKFGLLEALIVICLVVYWVINKKESPATSQIKEKNTHLFRLFRVNQKGELLLTAMYGEKLNLLGNQK